MKFFNQTMSIPLRLVLSILLGMTFTQVHAGRIGFSSPADTTVACNDLIQVSLDFNCEALITGEEILEGYAGDESDIEVQIRRPNGEPVDNPITGAYVGETLTITAIYIPNGNYCSGLALVKDLLPPALDCQDYTIQCFQKPSELPLPIAIDNCDAHPVVTMVNQVTDASDPCLGVTYTCTFIARDIYNNFSQPCTQVYQALPPSLPEFPKDTSWECSIYQQHANVINPTKLTGDLNTTGSGIPNVAIGNYCPYTVSYQTMTISECGSSFTLVRTWTVMNWCTGQIILEDINGKSNVQLIKVQDTTPPGIVMAPYTVSANLPGDNPNECKSVGFLPPAQVSDNCHDWKLRILTPVGEAIYQNGQNGNAGGIIPLPGLPLGKHTIVYEATDACGNVDTIQVAATVVDDIAPEPVCDGITAVALDNLGWAEVFANTFDDGTHDNCCLDNFLVRRMNSDCGNQDVNFDGSVFFCCEDIGYPVTVVFRAIDCAGNYNDCMVEVVVQDKILPVMVSCPPAQSINCDFYSENLQIPLSQDDFSVLAPFGQPVFEDNCQIVFLDTTVAIDIDQCLQGKITRNWIVTDASENGQLTCTQTISVHHVSDWVVEFPADVVVTCTEDLPETGQPQIFYEGCELVAIAYEDELFTIVEDACFKIARTWVVINWCAVGDEIGQEVAEASEAELNFDLNGNGLKNNRTFQDGLNASNFSESAALHGAQPDGYIVYQQIIKVIDDVKPVVTCEPILDVCIYENCDVTFELPQPEVEDCSSELDITAYGDLGNGFGPFVAVEPGNYSMTYKVSDYCGNTTYCSTLVVVRDCKKPTPYCVNGLNVSVTPEGFVITAPELEAGSYDNCDGELIFSFSPVVSDTFLELDCYDVGFVYVEVWVTDAAGNQDYCTTFIFVNDNTGSCQGPPLVAGTVTTENDLPLNLTTVNINGSISNEDATDPMGHFSFEAVWGGDYSVSCAKDAMPLNGVSTFDMVLISKHILGIELLDSPYKIIAADVNQSNSITTYDLVLIRKLILQITDEFPQSQSWRFIDKNFVFPDPTNPFLTDFPEAINYNNLQSDVLDANFIGVKIGDVNLSANPEY